MNTNNKFLQMWLIIVIIVGFTFIIFFTNNYLKKNILCDLHCNSQKSVTIAITLSALAGVFVGSLTYYLMSEKHEKQVDKIQEDVLSTIKFLEPNQQPIIRVLIKNNGKMTQSKLAKQTKLSRVQVSRELKQLEEKNIITKTPAGMTNDIELNNNLKKIFIN
ncbi:MAG: hypothetical protein MAG795_00027 [Candidatus Woesearchaeota archaeon]|nr:hypothetical protein [Candidatus Woesearchaeota archaeon]